MFSLGAYHNINEGKVGEDHKLGAEITRSCHEAYTRTQTKIGPEYFEFRNGKDFAVPYNGKHYLLRPGPSFFLLFIDYLFIYYLLIINLFGNIFLILTYFMINFSF